MEIKKMLIIPSSKANFEFIKSEDYSHISLQTVIDNDTIQLSEIDKEEVETLIDFLTEIKEEM